eukprot:GFUD01012420.1.p1 GENE.GFUD01012420.1~~GFUD01012420.1.p1  ORF type:complete len:144 (-),score=16.12 GFUD01012420.1:431-862(-)
MVIFGGLVLFILVGWGGQQGEAADCPYRVKVGRTGGTSDTLAHDKYPYLYGYYTIQNGLLNGKHWYTNNENDDYKIYWNSDKTQWIVTNKGSPGVAPGRHEDSGWVFTHENDACPHTVRYDWKYLSNHAWIDAEKSFSIWEYK